jgi:hypothetical protein
MFVGTKETSRSQRLMSYVGIYRAVRVDPLSKQEWSTLSSDVSFITTVDSGSENSIR